MILSLENVAAVQLSVLFGLTMDQALTIHIVNIPEFAAYSYSWLASSRISRGRTTKIINEETFSEINHSSSDEYQ